MEQSTPKKKIPVGLIVGLAAAALITAAVSGYFGLCAWVRDNDQLLPGAVAVDDRGDTVADLGKLTREDALAVVTKEMDQRLDNRTLTLLYGEGKRAELTGELMACAPEAAVDVGFSAKEDQPFWKLGALWMGAAKEPAQLSLSAAAFTPEGEAEAKKVIQVKEARVDMRLNHAPDRSEIMETKPDAVILVTGGTPRHLARVDMVPSAASCGVHILYGLDVLKGAEVPGKKAVVLRGRYIGIESALSLASEGHDVSLVDMGDIGQGMIHRIRGVLFRRLAQAGVRIFSHTSLFRITQHCVELAHGGGVFPLECDALILAIGTVPVKTWQECDFGVPTYAVGDCRKIGDAREAIAEGTAIGLRI